MGSKRAFAPIQNPRRGLDCLTRVLALTQCQLFKELIVTNMSGKKYTYKDRKISKKSEYQWEALSC